MKKIFVFLITSIMTCISTQAQLVSIFLAESKTINKTDELYLDYNFSTSFDTSNHIRYLKSPDGKKNYFKPDRPFYYEIFENKYLLATSIDSLIISQQLSTPPYFSFPRKRIYLMCLTKAAPKSFFYIDLQDEIIIEDAAKLEMKNDYFLIDKIDIKRMKIELFCPLKKIRKKYKIRLYSSL